MILHAGWREEAAGPSNAFHQHHPEGPRLEFLFPHREEARTESFGSREKGVSNRKRKMGFQNNTMGVMYAKEDYQNSVAAGEMNLSL